jgi:hypothetical protein
MAKISTRPKQLIFVCRLELFARRRVNNIAQESTRTRPNALSLLARAHQTAMKTARFREHAVGMPRRITKSEKS